MSKTVWESEYFFGHTISDYGLQHGFIDYLTLARAFDCILNNEIISRTIAMGLDWEIENGNECYWYDDNGNEYFNYDDIPDNKKDDIQENYYDFYQYYIISESGANILKDYTDETVWYCKELDCYVWGITHYGTAWGYVLTDIPIDKTIVEQYKKERKC